MAEVEAPLGLETVIENIPTVDKQRLARVRNIGIAVRLSWASTTE